MRSSEGGGVRRHREAARCFTELTLKVLEERAGLVRCHKQFLVNIDQVDEIRSLPTRGLARDPDALRQRASRGAGGTSPALRAAPRDLTRSARRASSAGRARRSPPLQRARRRAGRPERPARGARRPWSPSSRLMAHDSGPPARSPRRGPALPRARSPRALPADRLHAIPCDCSPTAPTRASTGSCRSSSSRVAHEDELRARARGCAPRAAPRSPSAPRGRASPARRSPTRCWSCSPAAGAPPRCRTAARRSRSSPGVIGAEANARSRRTAARSARIPPPSAPHDRRHRGEQRLRHVLRHGPEQLPDRREHAARLRRRDAPRHRRCV